MTEQTAAPPLSDVALLATAEKAIVPFSSLAPRSSAFHEAGHAVTFLVLGFDVRRAFVLARGGGCVQCAWPDVPVDERDPEAVMAAEYNPAELLPDGWSLGAYGVGIAAGVAAQRRVTADIGESAWCDTLLLQSLLGRALGQPPWSELVCEQLPIFTKFAEHYVNVHWQWIVNVANALLEPPHTLTGDQIRAMRT